MTNHESKNGSAAEGWLSTLCCWEAAVHTLDLSWKKMSIIKRMISFKVIPLFIRMGASSPNVSHAERNLITIATSPTPPPTLNKPKKAE